MKRNYWPLFFIGIFSFTLGMIIWTIYSAVQTPVHEDNTFLKSYQDIDKDFNKIVESNNLFLTKYDFKIKINKKEFGLVFNDMFLSQRVLEEKSNHKNIFINGNNKIYVEIIDKETLKPVDNAVINLGITRPTNNNNSQSYSNEDIKYLDGKYSLDFTLPLKGNWNITGTFKIGDNIGYLFIKSDAVLPK